MNLSDASALSESREIGDYFEAIIDGAVEHERARWASAFITNDWFTLRNERGLALTDAPAPAALRDLIDLTDRGVISRSTAKDVFVAMVESGQSAQAIVDERGLAQQNDADMLDPLH